MAQTFPALVAAYRTEGPAGRVTSTQRQVPPGSFHTFGQAIDLAGPTPSLNPNPAMDAIYDWVARRFPPQSEGGPTRELIYSGASRWISKGQWVTARRGTSVWNAHRNHVHWACPSFRYAPPPQPRDSLLNAGDEGDPVRTWQQQLRDAAGARIAVDGKFGPGTVEATRAFQRAAGLPADGVVGAATIAAMETLYHRLANQPRYDFDTAVVYRPDAQIDEGVALTVGAALSLKVLPLGHSERVRAAFLVGRAADATGPYQVAKALAGADRHATAAEAARQIQAGDRTVE